jgi:hypothetical protein
VPLMSREGLTGATSLAPGHRVRPSRPAQRSGPPGSRAHFVHYDRPPLAVTQAMQGFPGQTPRLAAAPSQRDSGNKRAPRPPAGLLTVAGIKLGAGLAELAGAQPEATILGAHWRRPAWTVGHAPPFAVTDGPGHHLRRIAPAARASPRRHRPPDRRRAATCPSMRPPWARPWWVRTGAPWMWARSAA